MDMREICCTWRLYFILGSSILVVGQERSTAGERLAELSVPFPSPRVPLALSPFLTAYSAQVSHNCHLPILK